jgi:hypothetical protein
MTIALLTLLSSIVTSVVVGYLTFLALRSTARPGLTVSISSSNVLRPGALQTIKFHLDNSGHWYAAPAATDLKCYVNFPASFEPKMIRFGSRLEVVRKKVGRGKGNTKYMVATGITLTHLEEGEDVAVDTVTPESPGAYKIRLAALSREGDCGVHELFVRVEYSAREEEREGGLFEQGARGET